MILLDTQAWVRLALDPRRISAAARSAIRRHARRGGVGVSIVSVWEAAWLARRGRLRLDRPLRDWLALATDPSRIVVHPLSVEICALAAELPAEFPTDPGDRLIAATAIALDCPLVSSDERLAAARPLRVVW